MATRSDRPLAERVGERLAGVDGRRVLLYGILVSLSGAFLLPLESGVMTAFKTLSGFHQTTPLTPPTPAIFTVESWITAWNALAGSMINSFLFVIPATVLSALMGSMAAYGLTHTNWRYQMPIVVLFVAGIFIPYQSVLVPLSRFWAILDIHQLLATLGPINVWQLPLMKDHYADLIELSITHAAYGIPICTLLFRSYYKSFSEEMIEAARLDSAGVAKIYWRIILPLSTPMFIVTFIFQFTNIWNDLLFALIIVGAGDGAPVTVALNNLTGGIIQQFNQQMAGAFLAAMPTLLVYILFGEQFARGVASRGGA